MITKHNIDSVIKKMTKDDFDVIDDYEYVTIRLGGYGHVWVHGYDDYSQDEMDMVEGDGDIYGDSWSIKELIEEVTGEDFYDLRDKAKAGPLGGISGIAWNF